MVTIYLSKMSVDLGLGDFYAYPEKDDIVEKTDVVNILKEPFCYSHELYYFEI